MQQWLALLRGQRLADWGFSAASCGSHCRPSGESRSLVCVGLQSCSQRAAWPLSAALSYLSRARPDSQPGLPRHKGGLVLRETGVSNPPSPLLLLTLVQADACCDRATYLKLSNMEKKGHLCHPFTAAISQETGAPSERSCQIWSIHQRRLSQSKSITDWDWVLTDWHADWQLYCVLWGTGMKGSHEEAAQTQTILSRAREELLVPLYALLFLCIESTSFSWQHSFSNCTKAAMEESDMLYSDYKASAQRTRESGISRGILASVFFFFFFPWELTQKIAPLFKIKTA